MHAKILLTLGITLVVGQEQPGSLIGRWRSAEVSPAGVSTVFEFVAGNQLNCYSSVFLEQKYRVVGTDTIILQSNGGREEKLELEWDHVNRARIDDEAAGKAIELVRVGKILDGQNPIVGEWSTTREWNGTRHPARAVFSANSRVLWITDLRADHGRYVVQNEIIRLEMPKRPVVEGQYQIAGDELTLPNPRGGQSVFKRF